jgi:hypothetical protein
LLHGFLAPRVRGGPDLLRRHSTVQRILPSRPLERHIAAVSLIRMRGQVATGILRWGRAEAKQLTAKP